MSQRPSEGPPRARTSGPESVALAGQGRAPAVTPPLSPGRSRARPTRPGPRRLRLRGVLETRPLLFQRAATQAHGSRGADRSPDSLGFRCATGENYSQVAQDFFPGCATRFPGCAGSLTPRLRSPGQPSRRLPPSDARVARVPVAGKPCRGVAWRGRGLAWLGAAWRGEGHNVGCPSQTRACTVVPRSAARTFTWVRTSGPT